MTSPYTPKGSGVNLGFRVYGLGSWVLGLGTRDLGLGTKDWSLGGTKLIYLTTSYTLEGSDSRSGFSIGGFGVRSRV